MSKGIIDTCCLLNLCAVGPLPDWLPALGWTWHVPEAVLGETLYLRTYDGNGEPANEEVDLRLYVTQGVLADCSVEPGEETRLYVELARSLDDGEAMALACAATRGWHLASDDRKARLTAGELGVVVTTTPELLRRWAETTNASGEEIAAAVGRVRDLARFVPSEGFPMYDWWVQHLG
jgi:hypothetical protein